MLPCRLQRAFKGGRQHTYTLKCSWSKVPKGNIPVILCCFLALARPKIKTSRISKLEERRDDGLAYGQQGRGASQTIGEAAEALASEAWNRWVHEEGNVVDDITVIVTWFMNGK